MITETEANVILNKTEPETSELKELVGFLNKQIDSSENPKNMNFKEKMYLGGLHLTRSHIDHMILIKNNNR